MENMNNILGRNKSLILNLKLPKKLEGSEEGRKLLMVLSRHISPVKPGFKILLPSFPLSESIIKALYAARRTGRLSRGIEDAEKKLAAERAGIAFADMKTGADRTERLSRVAVVANDGSERFYRQTKKIIEFNKPRVMAVHLDITSFELGERLFGPGKRVLFLLLNHKDAVTGFLMSLID